MLNFVVIILRKFGVTISFELAKKYIFIHIRMQDMFSIKQEVLTTIVDTNGISASVKSVSPPIQINNAS